MKKLVLPALCLLALACSSAPGASRQLPARQRVREAKSYYCYYGPDRVAELSHYDMVILHAPAATPEVVRQLKERGVVTIGYITCGADESVRDGDRTGPGGKASWYFDKDHDGKPDIDPIWKSPWANTADPKWRADRVAEAKRLVKELGFDGIFLDTVDNVSIYPDMFDGMVDLIQDFRRELPDAPIIMNQSWDLLHKVAPVIDGVMLEGFTTSYDFEHKRYRRNPPSWDDNGLRCVKRHIKPLQTKDPFQVIVLDYAEPQQTEFIQAAADRAATFGFLHCVAPVGLDDVYHYNVTPRTDEKYWKTQATPQSLSVTIDEPRYGFPAGTQVMPSGCFGGYTVAPVVDGQDDRSGLDWSKVAWASAEDGEPAWLEIRLPASRQAGTLRIEWESGEKDIFASRVFVVQTKSAPDATWSDAARFNDNNKKIIDVALPKDDYRFIRIYQDAGGGSAKRPDLMWISRIRLLP